jgi:serine/threonine protein kinase/predicted nucleic acid-binding protein
VYALNAEDGSEQWSSKIGGRLYSPPAVVDGTVYIGSSPSANVSEDVSAVHALDSRDGTEQWSFETGDGVTSSPAVADGTVYVGSRDESVYALDAGDGTERWSFETDDGVDSSPAVVDGTVYVGDLSSIVYALDREDGTERWSVEIEGQGTNIQSSPAVVNGTIYVSSLGVSALDGGRGTGATSASTPAAGPAETTAAGNRDERQGAVPVLPVILGALGLGGIGTWWYRQRDTDTETGSETATGGSAGGPTAASSTTTASSESVADESGSDSDSSPPQDSTATSDRSNGASQSGTEQSVRTRSRADLVPDEIPRTPAVSVDYDALTDREPIGGGGNADVTRATLETADGDVTLAIKQPRMAGTLHGDTVERLLNEAETWDKLDDHDHIVGVVDYGSEPIPWIAMEYMDGGHLGDRSGEMAVPQALWTAIAITEGVYHAHRKGIAHLDLKPQNVLFRTVEDAWSVPKVADWGLSKHLLEHSKSVEGMSVEYAAPEQFDDQYGESDDITDVYQLGAVFYELFTGRPPFEGQPFEVIEMIKTDQPTPPSEIADVPEELDGILLTALAKEKDDRYDDIVYLRDDLRESFDNW